MLEKRNAPIRYIWSSCVSPNVVKRSQNQGNQGGIDAGKSGEQLVARQDN